MSQVESYRKFLIENLEKKLFLCALKACGAGGCFVIFRG